MGSTLTTYDGLMKERYIDPDRVEKLLYGEQVLLGLLEKRGDTGMSGDQMPVPIIYGNPQGLSGGFSTAQTNATNLKADKKFNIVAGDYYGAVHIGDKVLKASRTNVGAFLSNKMQETDGLYEQAGENLSIYLHGNGGGAIGRRASISTNTITLETPADAANFEIDMVVVASDNDGSDAAHALRTGSTTVTAVNVSAGTVTVASAAAITSFANNDYLFRQGDFFGTTGTIVLKGWQCFITPTDTPMDLWGISSAVRASHPSRFAGCRIPSATLSNKTIEERMRLLGSYMTGRFKAKRPTAGFLHPEDFQQLETIMMSRGIRPAEDQNTKFGYIKIDASIGGGVVPIYQDRHMPKGHFLAARMENWWISSMGELIHPQNEDGLEMLRRASSTDYEFRLISYPLLACNAPLNTGRCSLT